MYHGFLKRITFAISEAEKLTQRKLKTVDRTLPRLALRRLQRFSGANQPPASLVQCPRVYSGDRFHISRTGGQHPWREARGMHGIPTGA